MTVKGNFSQRKHAVLASGYIHYRLSASDRCMFCPLREHLIFVMYFLKPRPKCTILSHLEGSLICVL